MLKESFKPIIGDRPKILILGSLPGDISLTKQEYYAHPQNRFWKVLSSIYDVDYPISYKNKIEFLKQNRIALWDVCSSAYRIGSMDTAIKYPKWNDIDGLLQNNPEIKTVIFNGKKAEHLFNKKHKRTENIKYVCLPSTSPANASWNFDKLMQTWKEVSKFNEK